MGLKTQSKKKIRTDIQALRALAVIAVVIYHLWPNRLTGGFMGVDIFFVISGYLMTLTILRDVNIVTEAKNKTRATFTFLINFYARRIKRLIPAAAVTLIGVLGLVGLTGNLDLIAKTARQVVTSALFVQNWQLASESTDYLAPSEPPTAVQHFWSLSLEEQFYLGWPLVLIVVALITSQLFIVYRNNKISGAILPLSAIAIAFFIYGYLLTKTDPNQAYFVTPARVWELIIGGLLVFLPSLKNHDLKLLLPWLGTAMNLYALFQLDGSNFPGWHALIPVIGTSLVLYGGTSDSTSTFSFSHLLRARPIQWIGDISYSLYLWHWPLIVLLPVLFTFDIEGNHSKWLKLSILALSLLIAWLSYKFVELPTQRFKPKKRWVYLLFILVVGGTSIGAFTAMRYAQAKADEGLAKLHTVAMNKNEKCFGARALNNPSKCPNPYNSQNAEWKQYVKTDASLNIIQDNRRFCEFYRMEDGGDPKASCEYGNKSASKTIAVIGDSHSDHWVNALNDIGLRNKIKFAHYSSGSCAADKITEPDCNERITFIKNDPNFKNASAVIAAFWIKDDYPRAANAVKAISSFTDAPVFLMQDVPYAGEKGGLDCELNNACTQPREYAMKAVNNITGQLIAAKNIASNHVIKTEQLFCKDELCYSYVGGVSVYRDSDQQGNSHISSVYSLSAAHILEASMQKIIDITFQEK